MNANSATIASHSDAAPQPAAGVEVARAHGNNFNIIRLILATSVIVAHSPEIIDGDRHREPLTRLFHTLSLGEVAVFGFFMLSGYLIAQSWLRRPRFGDFIRKRILRIYPGFVVAALISAFVVGPIGFPQGGYFAHISYVKLLALLPFLHLGGLPPVFPGFPQPSVNSPIWTIPYEFACYMLLAALGITHLLKRRALTAGLLALLVLLSVIPENSLPMRPGEPRIMLFYFIRFASFFLAGACFQLFQDRLPLKRGFAVGAAVILSLCLLRPESAVFAMQTCGTYLLLYFAFAPIKLARRLGRAADISYGVYLYAWPIQKLIVWWFHGITPLLLTLLTIGFSFGAGWLSWMLVERPFLEIKNRLGGA